MITQERMLVDALKWSFVRVGAELLLRLEHCDCGVVKYALVDAVTRSAASAAVTMAPILARPNISDEAA